MEVKETMMGTSQFKKLVMGSNTAKLLEKSYCPVMPLSAEIDV